MALKTKVMDKNKVPDSYWHISGRIICAFYNKKLYMKLSELPYFDLKTVTETFKPVTAVEAKRYVEAILERPVSIKEMTAFLNNDFMN